MIQEWFAVLLIAFAFAWGWSLGRGSARDGKSAFWTGFMDVTSLRCLWRDGKRGDA